MVTLQDDFHALARALVSGQPENVAKAAVKNPRVLRQIIISVCNLVNKECEHICRPLTDSLFRNASHTALTTLSVSGAIQELQSVAPTVWKLLGGDVASPNRDLVNQNARIGSHVVMATADLLKARNCRMSAFQSLVSVILFHSGAKKRAYRRLNQLGVSMSHKRTLCRIKGMASKFNTAVAKWKEDIELDHGQPASVSKQSAEHHQMTPSHQSDPECTAHDDGVSSEKNPSMGSHSSLSTIGWESEGSCNDVEPSFSLERKIFQETGDNIDISIKTNLYIYVTQPKKQITALVQYHCH